MGGGNLAPRWICWFISMGFFLMVVQELLVGLATATAEEGNDEIADKIRTAQRWTVVSWCTYPIVYLFPMFGIQGSMAVVGIQVGYSVSDIISVRCWPRDLPDQRCEVEARVGAGSCQVSIVNRSSFLATEIRIVVISFFFSV